jgi:hypothetical protein
MCCPKCARFGECLSEWDYFQCYNWSASDYVANVKKPELEVIPRH